MTAKTPLGYHEAKRAALEHAVNATDTDQMEISQKGPHLGLHLGGPGIGMPETTTTITDIDAPIRADQVREEVSKSGFKETTDAKGEKRISAESRAAKFSLGAGAKVTIEIDLQAIFFEAGEEVLEEKDQDKERGWRR